MAETAQDGFNLQRFLDAQTPIYPAVCAELRGGRKRTHWMWFIFPQIQGLAHSETSRRFAIVSRDEATAYLRHPVLGARLEECTALVNGVQGRSAHDIFGAPDDMKFRSCMTLFAAIATQDSAFHHALIRYFDGQGDTATLDRL